MTEQAQPAITSTVLPSWTRIPGRNVVTPSLEIAFQRRGQSDDEKTIVEEIHLEPPRAWKPGTVFIGQDIHKLAELKAGSVLSDSHAVTWEVSQRVTRDTWRLILCNTKPETALPKDWGLSVAILLEKPLEQTQGKVQVSVADAGECLEFKVPETTNPPWILHLDSDPAETNALVRGQEVVLRWEVQNIEGDAELRGSLAGANTLRIANGAKGERTVRALGESVYSLRAKVAQDGKLVEVVRWVHLNLAAPQSALDLNFLPASVFPGGPTVCYRSAYNVKKIKFTRNGDDPSLAAYNYVGKETTIVDTFVVPHGPKEGRNYSYGATVGTPTGEKSVQGNTITGIVPTTVENSQFMNLPVSFGGEEPPRRVHAIAAGTFIVTSEGPDPEIAKREWIAIAADVGLELWARDPSVGEVQAPADMLANKWTNNWLADALAGVFFGVGAATNIQEPEMQSIIAVRKKSGAEGVVEVIEIDLPLRENNPHRQALAISDPRFTNGTVRVVAIGNRVFLFGNGAAISYARNLQVTKCRDEGRLAFVADREWEIAGITAENRKQPSGYLFALEKKSGNLLRFDVQEDVVMAPRMCARGNDKVARLDKLQAAQACLSPTPPPFPREDLEEGRGFTGKDTDGKILEYLNPINENSTMVALGGVLLVRSEVVDPSVGKTIQDRAYDPRLDVWARCGHPFVDIDRSSTKYFAATHTTLYCFADDVLRYVEGSLPSYLGFIASDYTPIDAQSLAPPAWPEKFTFPTVVNKTSLDLQWVDGRMSPTLFEQGQMRLELQYSKKTLIAIDATINRETGAIQNVTATEPLMKRKPAICRWEGSTLTIAPMPWRLQINMDGLVPPFSYSTSEEGVEPVTGETSTGNAIEIPCLTAETKCTIEFKYTSGNARDGALKAKFILRVVYGKVSTVDEDGPHAKFFKYEIEDGRILHFSLNKDARG